MSNKVIFMRKLLRSQEILLLGLSGALDLFEEIRDPFSLVSKSYDQMYGWIPSQYKRNHFTHLMWRSIKTGYIEKIEKEGEVYIRLTTQGAKRITRDFPLLSFQKRKWDKKWRAAIFDIQEINRKLRDNLRQKLKELGFGMLQKSVFISPHDILQDFSEFIKYHGLGDVVYVFTTSNLAIGDVKAMANRIWKLDTLNERYKEVLEKGKEIENRHLTKPHDRGKMLNDKSEGKGKGGELKRGLKNEYLRIVLTDPFLPKELLPSDWLGNEAKSLIKNL